MLFPYTLETAEKFKIIKTSDFGYRRDPVTGRRQLHDGIDLAPQINVTGDIPIIATVNGFLKNQKDQNGALYCYIIGDNGQDHMTVHHKKFLRPNNERVKIGDQIALMGRSGKATGVHTHFEVRFRPSKTGFDPNPLIYYDDDMLNLPSWEETNEWNNDIKDKGLTSEKVQIQDDNKPSKLANGDLNEDQKYTLRLLKAFNDMIPVPIRNTQYLDGMMKRYALYLGKSNAR
jgi:murein DD-endopeptidase MepM/ murein hydrolase activator NlpD